MSWLALFADAGCLTDEAQKSAQKAVHDYTAALQQSLSDAGYYSGKVDGVYGPSTVDAVQSLQKAHGLPVTGTVDKATQAAAPVRPAGEGRRSGAAGARVDRRRPADPQARRLLGRPRRRPVDTRPDRGAQGVPDRARRPCHRDGGRRDDRRAREGDRRGRQADALTDPLAVSHVDSAGAVCVDTEGVDADVAAAAAGSRGARPSWCFPRRRVPTIHHDLRGRGSIGYAGRRGVIVPSHLGAVAQLVARLVRNEKVRGSNPLSSTTRRRTGHAFRLVLLRVSGRAGRGELPTGAAVTHDRSSGAGHRTFLTRMSRTMGRTRLASGPARGPALVDMTASPSDL